MDVFDSISLVRTLGIMPRATILDPWYNKGYGGIKNNYREEILTILGISVSISDHIFLWGFPEIVAYFVDKLPEPLILVDLVL